MGAGRIGVGRDGLAADELCVYPIREASHARTQSSAAFPPIRLVDAVYFHRDDPRPLGCFWSEHAVRDGAAGACLESTAREGDADARVAVEPPLQVLEAVGEGDVAVRDEFERSVRHAQFEKLGTQRFARRLDYAEALQSSRGVLQDEHSPGLVDRVWSIGRIGRIGASHRDVFDEPPPREVGHEPFRQHEHGRRRVYRIFPSQELAGCDEDRVAEGEEHNEGGDQRCDGAHTPPRASAGRGCPGVVALRQTPRVRAYTSYRAGPRSRF